MPDLIAQGAQPQDRWRRRLPSDRTIVLGCAKGTGAVLRDGWILWDVPWDKKISREHAKLGWEGQALRVQSLSKAKNSIFVKEKKVEDFQLQPGDHFVIGATTFTLADEQVNLSLDVPRPVTEQTFSPDDLRRVEYRNADQRIVVLGRLPDIIRGASSDNELFIRLVNVLLSGIPRASAAALVDVNTRSENSQPVVLYWDRRLLTGEEFQPSEKLIRQAAEQGESVAHSWRGGPQKGKSAYTLSEGVDWAFSTPVPGDACRDWVIYVAGRFDADNLAGSRVSDPYDLRDDLKFTELLATTLGNLRELRLLERTYAGLRQFFSPVVLKALAGKDPDVVLAPRQTKVSVLFCDLRGYSRKSELATDDPLELLHRVSRALGVMTRQILDQRGVVGDFHGDAAMGFWGWPLPQDDAIQRICNAALAIRTEFETASRREAHPLTDFRVGLGIATGPAVAGKIGTDDHVKVTVFGHVVNLASRLEGMTKVLRAGILLDETTAQFIRQHIPHNVARVRRLAVVRPYGLRQEVEVSELLPPERDYPELNDEHLANYELAVDALLSGDWTNAFELLHQVPADDRAKDFLTVFMAKNNRTPPDNWDGVIPIGSK